MSREVSLQLPCIIAVDCQTDVAIGAYQICRVAGETGVADRFAPGKLVNPDPVARAQRADILVDVLKDVHLPLERLKRGEVVDMRAPGQTIAALDVASLPLLSMESE